MAGAGLLKTRNCGSLGMTGAGDGVKPGAGAEERGGGVATAWDTGAAAGAVPPAGEAEGR
jgi:hypothetical protein